MARLKGLKGKAKALITPKKDKLQRRLEALDKATSQDMKASKLAFRVQMLFLGASPEDIARLDKNMESIVQKVTKHLGKSLLVKDSGKLGFALHVEAEYGFYVPDKPYQSIRVSMYNVKEGAEKKLVSQFEVLFLRKNDSNVYVLAREKTPSSYLGAALDLFIMWRLQQLYFVLEYVRSFHGVKNVFMLDEGNDPILLERKGKAFQNANIEVISKGERGDFGGCLLCHLNPETFVPPTSPGGQRKLLNLLFHTKPVVEETRDIISRFGSS